MANMEKKQSYFCVNIRSYLEANPNQIIGENELQKILSDFSSPKNQDAENFLKNNAIDFSKSTSQLHTLCFLLKTRDGRLFHDYDEASHDKCTRVKQYSKKETRQIQQV